MPQRFASKDDHRESHLSTIFDSQMSLEDSDTEKDKMKEVRGLLQHWVGKM